LHSLIKKTTILITLTTLCGCSTFLKDLQNTTIGQYTSSSVKEPQGPKDTALPEKTTQPEKTIKLPPLLSGGTKRLVNQELMEKIDFPPDPKDKVSPCIDPKTGKEKNFLLADLPTEIVPVAYSSLERILSALQVMGVKTIEAKGPLARPYTVDKRGKATMLPQPKLTHDKIGYACSELPIFFKPQSTPIKSLTSAIKPAHGGQQPGSKFTFVDMPSIDYGLHESLIAFYHPAGRKRFNNIKKTVQDTLDAAPVQVYIESMVLEVNESGMEELGVLYKANVPGNVNQTFQVGSTSALTAADASADGQDPFLNLLFAKGAGAASVSQLLSAQIKALVANGSAEVLSRPSVITLDNRPAVIEVTEQKQFPTTTTSGTQGYVTTSFGFEEVTPGILLQIRPRVSEAKDEVAMEIDVQIKALRAANDGKALNSDDPTKIIGTKPGSSTRRVHTFTLVPNKTPIIIGGLVQKDLEGINNKVPGLGDIPFLGRLFGSEKTVSEKKEVIVVITPHIIRDNRNIGIQTPKDTAMFDDLDMELFRDSYRVRAEDMFDLGFVYRSSQFSKYRNYVVRRAERDEAFAKTPLAESYSGAHFPGGNGLVARMLYDIVGKRDLAKPVSRDKILMTEHAGDGNFEKVTFLEKVWKKAQAKSNPAKEGGKRGPGYGLELKFLGKKGSSVQPHVALRILPLAEIKVLTDTTGDKKDSSRIFIASEKDLKKIRRAIVVREIQKLNKSKLTFGLNEFSNGTKLILPVIKTTRYFLLDSDVATVYHQIKFYYDILEESLKESFLLVQKEIKSENKAEERRQAEQLRIQTQQRQMQQRQMQQRQAQPKTQPAPSKQPTNGRKGLSQ